MSDRKNEDRRNAQRAKVRALEAQLDGRFQTAEMLRDTAHFHISRHRFAERRAYR